MIIVDLTAQQSGSVRSLFSGRYRCPHKRFNSARAAAVEARCSWHLPAQSLRSRGAAPALNPRGRPRHRRRRWAALGGARRRIREGATKCILCVTGSEGAHHLVSTRPALHAQPPGAASQHRVKFCAMLSRGRCRRMRWYPSCAPCAAPPSPARCRPPPARLAAAFSGARLADLRAGTPRQRRFRDGAPFRAGCSSARPEGCRSLSFVRNRLGRSPETRCTPPALHVRGPGGASHHRVKVCAVFSGDRSRGRRSRMRRGPERRAPSVPPSPPHPAHGPCT